jgi:hypothetical protein
MGFSHGKTIEVNHLLIGDFPASQVSLPENNYGKLAACEL